MPATSPEASPAATGSHTIEPSSLSEAAARLAVAASCLNHLRNQHRTLRRGAVDSTLDEARGVLRSVQESIHRHIAREQPAADTTGPASPPAAGKRAEPQKPFTGPVHTFEFVAAGCGEDRKPSSHARCLAIEMDVYGDPDQQRRTLQATFDALAQSFLRRDTPAPGQNLDVKA